MKAIGGVHLDEWNPPEISKNPRADVSNKQSEIHFVEFGKNISQPSQQKPHKG